MKRIILLISILFLPFCSFCQTFGEGIRFIEGKKWDIILKMAQEQNKFIFMDCYTSWCGPCKVLAQDIFTHKDVGDFFNANFINVKYDMEKGIGKELHAKYKKYIIGYPTLLLIDKTGQVVHQMAGFQETDVLITSMKSGMEGKSLFAYKNKYHQEGVRDLNFLKEYVIILQKAFLKDEIERVVMDYMKNLPLEKLQEKDVWDFVGKYVKDPYSKQFEYVVFNIDRIAQKTDCDRYNLEKQLNIVIEKAVKQVVKLNKVGEYDILPFVDNQGKVDTLLRLINRVNLKRAEEYRAKIKIYQFALDKKWQEMYNYLSVCKDIEALGYSDTYLDDMIQYIAVYCQDKELLKHCLAVIKWLQAQEDKRNEKFKINYYDTLALLYEKLGDSKTAKEFRSLDEKLKAEKAKEFEEFIKKSKYNSACN